MNPLGRARPGALSVLRQFARKREAALACDLCAAPLPPGHPHLVDPVQRELRCACGACAVLFSETAGTRWKRVPRRAELLEGFRLTDASWDALRIPIGMAFFLRSSALGRVAAFYPSPAGATECLIPLEAWGSLEAENPALASLAPDVEALLVNRIGGATACYRVSIDECYRLVGLLRLHWRGFSGGEEVWAEIGRFFAGLLEAPHA